MAIKDGNIPARDNITPKTHKMFPSTRVLN